MSLDVSLSLLRCCYLHGVPSEVGISEQRRDGLFQHLSGVCNEILIRLLVAAIYRADR